MKSPPFRNILTRASGRGKKVVREMAKHVVISAVKIKKKCYPKTPFGLYVELDGKQINCVSGYRMFSDEHERWLELRIMAAYTKQDGTWEKTCKIVVVHSVTKEGSMAKFCEMKKTEDTLKIMVDGHEIKDVISYSIEHRGEVQELVMRIAITDELQLQI